MAQHSYRHTCQGCSASWRSAKKRTKTCGSCGCKKVATAPLPWLPDGRDYDDLDFVVAGAIIFSHFGEVEHSARWAQAILAETAANTEELEMRLSSRDRRLVHDLHGRVAL